VSLAVAIAQVERYFGAGWYFNPQRWPTVDGYAPWAVVWVQWRAMHALEAHERMSMRRAVRLGTWQGDGLAAELEAEARMAYPDDPEDAA
jgi:hypothetical protein